MKSGQPRPMKIRRNWGPIKPVTKIKESNKLYDRKDKDWKPKESDA